MTITPELKSPASATSDNNCAIVQAFAFLLQAHEYTLNLNQDVWEFAVEIAVLRGAGLTRSDLRWMVCKGYVSHGIEITSSNDRRRVFQLSPNLSFDRRTCFVLTPPGVQYGRSIHSRLADVDEPVYTSHLSSWNSSTSELVPTWDKDRHTLRLGDIVVKCFKTAAPNQEAILSAFQEEGWPPRVDDPISPQRGQDPKARLHDTINALNRNQKHRLIRFLGDGTGQGIRWERIHEQATRKENVNVPPGANGHTPFQSLFPEHGPEFSGDPSDATD